MLLNLVQHRGPSSVWDTDHHDWDPERWIGAALAGVCLVSGFRRRSATGWLLTLGGATLAWWAAAGISERDSRRARLRLVWPLRRTAPDPVDEALEESFPASDASSLSGHGTDEVGEASRDRRGREAGTGGR